MGTDLGFALEYLRDLSAHNERSWFEANKAAYARARAAFDETVGRLIEGIQGFEELEGVGPEACVFRINRDVRFSADKSPYKTHFGALIGNRGRKSGIRAYYFHLEPGASLAAGGLHHPEPAELAAFRSAVERDPSSLRGALGASEFRRHFGGISGEELRTAPRGVPKDHPDLDLLRKKQVLALRALSDAEILAEDLVQPLLESYRAMRPFLLVLEAMLEG